MSVNRSLITPTANPLLEQALREKLQRRSETTGSLGELEPLAIRLGLIQNTLKPRFRSPQIVLFASDHGLAVDGIGIPGRASTAKLVARLLGSQLPVSVFARIQGLELSVVDCGGVNSLTVLPVFFAQSSVVFLQNSKSWPTEPQEMVIVAACAPATEPKARAMPAAICLKELDMDCLRLIRVVVKARRVTPRQQCNFLTCATHW